MCLNDLMGHNLSHFPRLLKIVGSIQKRVDETYNLHCKFQSTISFHHVFLKFDEKLDVNTLLTFCVRHFLTERINMPVQKHLSTAAG